jgi:hypothetical protein
MFEDPNAILRNERAVYSSLEAGLFLYTITKNRLIASSRPCMSSAISFEPTVVLSNAAGYHVTAAIYSYFSIS